MRNLPIYYGSPVNIDPKENFVDVVHLYTENKHRNRYPKMASV